MELLVVMAIIAILLTIVSPRYFNSVDRAKETVLKQNLVILRDAIDKYFVDKGKYPADLHQLVEDRYIRVVPVDPITEDDVWVEVPPPDPEMETPLAARSTARGCGSMPCSRETCSRRSQRGGVSSPGRR